MQEYLPVNSVFTCAGELIYDKCPAGDGQRGVRAGRGALTSPRACAGYTPWCVDQQGSADTCNKLLSYDYNLVFVSKARWSDGVKNRY